ncbi:MAG: hypothetical protein JJT96_00700 [Opitutales bacterium]|nr:hypothetical protein [Opitutales bacterium]
MTQNTDTPLYCTHTTVEKFDSDTKNQTSSGNGKSARERLHLRTRELAVLAGRRSIDITWRDYEQAKQDVTGESTPERQNAILDAVV